MKKALLLLSFLFALHIHAANTLYVSDVTIPHGGTAVINIELNNDSEFFGLQMDVNLPAGISPIMNGEKPMYELTDRLTGFTIDSSLPTATTVRLAGFSLGSSVVGSSGTIIQLTVSADPSLNVGEELTATISSVQFSSMESAPVDFDDISFKITIGEEEAIVLDENSTEGPASSDGPVNVKVLRTIKGGEWNTICLPFTMSSAQISAALGSIELADFVDYEVTKSGDKNIAILVNFSPVNTSDGMEANHPYLIRTSSDISEFSVPGVVLEPDEENALTVYFIRKGKQTIDMGYMIGTYHAQTTVPADNLFISSNKFYYSTGKTKMQAYRAYFELTDILDRNESASSKITFMFSDTDRIEGLRIYPADSSAIFDLQGRKVADSVKDVQSLPKGVYIINGKKVVR